MKTAFTAGILTLALSQMNNISEGLRFAVGDTVPSQATNVYDGRMYRLMSTLYYPAVDSVSFSFVF